MKTRHTYDIAFVGLKKGVHDFNYAIDDEFFSNYEQPDFTGSNLQVTLHLDKKSDFFLLKFDITGDVTLNCDRCGDPFTLNIWDEFNLLVKMVEHPENIPADEDPDVVYIAKTESHLQVAGWIYEFILLSIPMQHIHPDKENGEPGCNPVVLKKLSEMEQQSKPGNPVWKGLDKFRNL